MARQRRASLSSTYPITKLPYAWGKKVYYRGHKTLACHFDVWYGDAPLRLL